MASRPDDLIRETVLARLPAAGHGAVVVVCAPAGWGKTSLLTSWVEREAQAHSGWYGLSEADDDPHRFLDRLVAAIGPIVGEVDQPVAEVTTAVWAEEVLPGVCDRLSRAGPAIIVLDDFHVITSPEVHHVVQALIDGAPPTTSIVLSTRYDPPLRLARLRAARSVIELRAVDLAFTPEEADQLLRRSFGLGLQPHEVDLLVDRTEGWAAAISLAGRSLRRVDEPEAFLTNFVSSDRYIVDYLGEELLATVSPEVRSFLTSTSIVDRFTVEEAGLLAGQTDATDICHDLERRGLLTRELDGGRIWFRYHQLVRDWLYGRLSPEARSDRHLAAARWLQAAGLAEEAIEQLIAGGDRLRATDEIDRHSLELIMRGRHRTVMRWVAAMTERGEIEPRLLLIGANAGIYGGHMAQGRAWLDEAEAAGLPELGDNVLALLLRTTVIHAQGRISDAAAVADRLVELLERIGNDSDLPAAERAEAYFVAALAQLTAGRDARSRPALERCLSIAMEPGANQIVAVAALGLEGFDAFGRDDVATCRALIAKAFELADRLGLARTALHLHLPVLLMVLVGEDRQARAAVDDLRAFNEFNYSPYGIALTHVAEAQYHARLDDHDAARQALVVAADLLGETEQPSPPVEHAYELVAAQLPGAVGAAEPPPGPDALTDRELQVLRALSSNLTQREIGRELFLSFNTIKTYARSSYRKLGVTSRAEAVQRCRQAGLF